MDGNEDMTTLAEGDSIRKLSEIRAGDFITVQIEQTIYTGEIAEREDGSLILVSERGDEVLLRYGDGDYRSTITSFVGVRGKLPKAGIHLPPKVVVTFPVADKPVEKDNAKLLDYSALIDETRKNADDVRLYRMWYEAGRTKGLADIFDELADALASQKLENDKLLALYAEGVAERAALQDKIAANNSSTE